MDTGTADDQANGSACSYWLLPSFPLGGSSRPDLNGTSVPGLDVLPVWRTTRGAGVTVAVVDTGVDGNSGDLRPNLVAGWNFYDGNADTRDTVGHGTLIASIIAAPANNGGYVGIAPEARILPVKIMGDGEFRNAAAVAGIRYAITHGARVINASFGGLNEPIPGMDAALRAARQADVLVVIAAGNSGVDLDSGRNTQSPNGYGLSNTLTVANFSNHGHLNSDSNFGARHVQIAGIGETSGATTRITSVAATSAVRRRRQRPSRGSPPCCSPHTRPRQPNRFARDHHRGEPQRALPRRQGRGEWAAVRLRGALAAMAHPDPRRRPAARRRAAPRSRRRRLDSHARTRRVASPPTAAGFASGSGSAHRSVRGAASRA